MKAYLTARRTKSGKEEEFRTKWVGGDTPDGMLAAYLLEDEEDPRETLSVSFWDSAEQLLGYRTSEDAKKRDDDLSGVVDKQRWQRAFVAWAPWELAQGGGKKKFVALPLLLAGLGAGVFFFLKRRQSQNDQDEWENWQPEPETAYQPPSVASAPTSAAAPPSYATSNVVVAEVDVPLGAGELSGDQPLGRAGTSASAVGTLDRDHVRVPETWNEGDRIIEGAGVSAAGAGTSPTMSARRVTGGRGGQSVRALMTPDPETVDIKTTADAAARLMRDLDVGVLPVTAQGDLAGVVTDRDLALGVSTRGSAPHDVMVGDLMTETPVTIGPDASVEDAAALMASHQIRRLPVVEGSRIVGILALGDLATDGAETAAGMALEEISVPTREG